MPRRMDESPLPPAPTVEQAGEDAALGLPTRNRRTSEQLMRSHVHYLGVRITDEGREYTLRATNEAPRLFVVLITHQHFLMGRVRYQDGPDLCCAKITRMLMGDAGTPDESSPMVLTAAELAEYRAGSAGSPAGRRRNRRADTESTR